MRNHLPVARTARLVLAATLALFGFAPAAQASTAYGTLNNFDCVNDTGVEAHGFEIELDDVHSTDITYTYDYNHYGIPKITEDNSDPAHPKVFIRYAATRTGRRHLDRLHGDSSRSHHPDRRPPVHQSIGELRRRTFRRRLLRRADGREVQLAD